MVVQYLMPVMSSRVARTAPLHRQCLQFHVDLACHARKALKMKERAASVYIWPNAVRSWPAGAPLYSAMARGILQPDVPRFASKGGTVSLPRNELKNERRLSLLYKRRGGRVRT